LLTLKKDNDNIFKVLPKLYLQNDGILDDVRDG